MPLAASHFHSLQILRGIAAWMVVYHHVMQFYFSFHADSAIGHFFAKYGNFGVDIFFVLSGFVMYFSARNKNQSGAEFLVNRAFRIMPVYWFYTAATMLCSVVFARTFRFTDIDANSVVMSLVFLPHQNPAGIGVFPLLPVGWTLNFEMFFYLTLGCCLMLNRKNAIFICMAAISILPIIYPSNMYYAEIAGRKLLYEFVVGLSIAMLYSNPRARRFLDARALPTQLIVLPILLAMCSMLHRFPDLKFPLAMTVVFQFLLLEKFINPGSAIPKTLIRLGDESYSTYLAHMLTINVLLYFTGNSLDTLLILLLVTICTWLVSRWSHRHIEQNQLLNSAKKRLVLRYLPA